MSANPYWSARRNRVRDLLAHQLDAQVRGEVLETNRARQRVAELIVESRFFTVEPLPDGWYEILVKDDR